MVEKTEPTTSIVDFKIWSKLLKDNECPFCGTPTQRIPDPAQLFKIKTGCTECNTFFKPKVELSSKPRKNPTIREKEEKARRSGGSLYPPLELHFFCPYCLLLDDNKIKDKNIMEEQLGIPKSEPIGDEGLTAAKIHNRTLIRSGDNMLPFTCSCGNRYFVSMTIEDMHKTKKPKFGVELGFHTDCFSCEHSFDKTVGSQDMTFKCDFDLDCPHIRKNPNRFYLVDDE